MATWAMLSKQTLTAKAMKITQGMGRWNHELYENDLRKKASCHSGGVPEHPHFWCQGRLARSFIHLDCQPIAWMGLNTMKHLVCASDAVVPEVEKTWISRVRREQHLSLHDWVPTRNGI